MAAVLKELANHLPTSTTGQCVDPMAGAQARARGAPLIAVAFSAEPSDGAVMGPARRPRPVIAGAGARARSSVPSSTHPPPEPPPAVRWDPLGMRMTGDGLAPRRRPPLMADGSPLSNHSLRASCFPFLFRCRLAVAAAALGVLFLMGVLLRDLVNAARLGSLPGPPRWPIVGNIPDLLKEPWLRFFEFYQQYGGIYKMFIWGQPLVVVSDPELVREIFLTNPDHYPKNNWSYSFFEPILGEGLVTSSGEHWRKQRRLLRPPFEAASMDRLMPVFRAAADRLWFVATRGAG